MLPKPTTPYPVIPPSFYGAAPVKVPPSGEWTDGAWKRFLAADAAATHKIALALAADTPKDTIPIEWAEAGKPLNRTRLFAASIGERTESGYSYTTITLPNDATGSLQDVFTLGSGGYVLLYGKWYSAHVTMVASRCATLYRCITPWAEPPTDSARPNPPQTSESKQQHAAALAVESFVRWVHAPTLAERYSEFRRAVAMVVAEECPRAKVVTDRLDHTWPDQCPFYALVTIGDLAPIELTLNVIETPRQQEKKWRRAIEERLRLLGAKAMGRK